MKVKKRNGSIEDFDLRKIIQAIKKADYDSSELTDSKMEAVLYSMGKIKLHDKMPIDTNTYEVIITIEQIQEIVEKALVKEGLCNTARNYISYRESHDMARDKYAKLHSIIESKLFAKNVENQNANVDERSFGGRKGEMASALLKDYALTYCMSKAMKDAHNDNEIYVHDLDSYALGLHNCFQRDTKVVTDMGIRSFSQMYDGEKIEVLDKDGVWRNATVKMFGRQKMQRVTLQRLGKKISFDCTSNHRWILYDGSITESIKIGDRLLPLTDSTSFSVKNKREAEMFCLGFIIGDGCNQCKVISARLCNDKNKYSNIFDMANYKCSKVKDTDDYMYYAEKGYDKQSFLDNKMWKILSFRDKIALFNGYISADGRKTTAVKKIWTSDSRVLEMIKDISAISGYHIFNIKETVGDTKYKKNIKLYEITFTTSYSNDSLWEVINIERKRNSDYEAWCVEEPVTHTFTLAGGIVTGNCLTLPIDKLLKVGFATKQVDIRPANSINTAFQLLAVMFQLQSLNQFGGVSVSHLDWSMVPYVRKSFYKHYFDGAKYIESVVIDKGEDNPEDISIDDETFYSLKGAYKYAQDMTEKELNQAVEGMYHNLSN